MHYQVVAYCKGPCPFRVDDNISNLDKTKHKLTGDQKHKDLLYISTIIVRNSMRMNQLMIC